MGAPPWRVAMSIVNVKKRTLQDATTEDLTRAMRDIEGSLTFLRSGPAFFEVSAREKMKEIEDELFRRKAAAKVKP
jgi:hypothetical protein